VATLLVENLGLSRNIKRRAAATYDRFAVGAFIDLSSDGNPNLKELKIGGITTVASSDYSPFLKRHFRLLGIQHYFACSAVSIPLDGLDWLPDVECDRISTLSELFELFEYRLMGSKSPGFANAAEAQ
jgi:hypothetical protein